MLQGHRDIRALTHCWWGHKLELARGKAAWHFLKQVNQYLLYDLAIQILGFYPGNIKAHVHTQTHAHSNK